MMIDAFRGTDRLLRSFAYDILCRRDQLSGWKTHRDALLASIRRDRASLARDVESRLQQILIHAYESCPYYRDLWDDIGFQPSTSFRADDLVELPFLTKDIIQEKKSAMVSDRFESGELDLSYTGGTMGTHTSFYRDHACTVNRVGRQWGILELCGYRPGNRRALVWGVHDDVLPTGTRMSLKQRFRKYASAQETLCCTVMTEQMMIDYHAGLLRFRPDLLYGYPNAITHFGRFIQEMGLKPIRVKTIITTAERLTNAQRDLLKKVFEGEVFNLYCTREYGCVGFECEKHEGFHVDIESVFVEIIKNGRRVDPGEPGEIAITDLLNYGMPLIRSRTGDMGALSPKPCECGSPLPVLKGLDGRTTDLVYRPDESIVAGVMLVDLFMDIPSIQLAQFIQESTKELDVFLVVTRDFSDDVEKEALRQVRELMGWDIAINIRRVAEIPRNPRSGKYQEVICKINRCQELDSLEREA